MALWIDERYDFNSHGCTWLSSETQILLSSSWELGTHPSPPQLLFALLITEVFGSGYKS